MNLFPLFELPKNVSFPSKRNYQQNVSAVNMGKSECKTDKQNCLNDIKYYNLNVTFYFLCVSLKLKITALISQFSMQE